MVDDSWYQLEGYELDNSKEIWTHVSGRYHGVGN